MAYKTFANGFPLPASDLNNFLMNQSVIVFADSAARGTAIPSPVQGMLTYLVDTSAYESWNGSAFVSISNPGDITAVTAGTGLTGGGTSGDVTLNLDTSAVIPSSTVTTAQDLIVADGASSVTRLGVGTDDQVLSVVAGEVAWADAGGGGLVWTQIYNSTIPTGGATGTITGLSGYDNYSLRMTGLSGSLGDITFFKLLINGDGTATGSAFENSQDDSELLTVSDIPLGSCRDPSDTIGGFFSITGASSTAIAEINYLAGSPSSRYGHSRVIGGSMANKDSAALASIGFQASQGTIDAGSVIIWGA